MTHYRTPIVHEPAREPSWLRRLWWALRREWDASCWFNGVEYTVRDGIVWREQSHRDHYEHTSTACSIVQWCDVPPHWQYVLRVQPTTQPPLHWPYPDDDELPPGASRGYITRMD